VAALADLSFDCTRRDLFQLMLTVLANLVGNPEEKLRDPSSFNSERTDTVSTAATEEVVLETIPFLVEVLSESDEATLGMTVSLDDDPGYLTIDDVRPQGLIAGWNLSHAADSMVHAGQIITSVNGMSSSAHEMLVALQICQKGAKLQLLIEPARRRRTSEHEKLIVSIDDGTPILASFNEGPHKPVRRLPILAELRPRKGTPLGLAVSLDDDPSYVTIDDIATSGLIAEWNDSHSEESQVYVGDVIESVNRCSGNGRQMLNLLTAIDNLNQGAVLQVRIDTRHPMCRRRRT
jgi:hypothetical protein